MAAWGNKGVVSPSAPSLSFKSIIQQQQLSNEANQFNQFPLDSANEVDVEVSSIDDSSTIECSNDAKLARLLQQLENEDSSLSYENSISQGQKRHPDQNLFSKISVVSRYDSSTTSQNRAYSTSSVCSSDYEEAVHRESQMNSVGVDSSISSMFKGGVTMLPDGNFVSKHDCLLNSLSNSVKLTEIDGMGDLSGAGLLIGNSVANSIRSSAQKKRNK
jgi:hypothetical protein